MNESAGNNKVNALAGLLNKLDLPTLVMVLFMGGANIFETQTRSEINAEAINRASGEIHELYPKLMQALHNQNEMMDRQAKQLSNQGTMLENQQKTLQNQEKTLEALQAGQRRFFGGGTEHP